MLGPLLSRARRSAARLLLAGRDLERLKSVAAELKTHGLDQVAVSGVDLLPESDPRLEAVASQLRARRPERVKDGIHALDLAADPLRFAMGLLALGDAEAVVTGPEILPAELAELAEWIVGRSDEERPMRSASWLLRDDGLLVAAADCTFPGVPAPDERAWLAGMTAEYHSRIAGSPPVVALLDQPERFPGGANVLIFPDGPSAFLAARGLRALGGQRLLGPLLIGAKRVIAGVVEDADPTELAGTAMLAMLAATTAAT
ncbi:MAG: hypothetical protein HOP28_04740 [Gemmatimonadales bacterium]|nr:hypothetical protein [Gemmatimonadales bacterium]